MRQHYDTLFAQGAEAARLGQLLPDPYLRHPATDTRRGLTLLIPLAPAVAHAATEALAALRPQEPALYYYPAPDLHLTLLTPLTGQPGQQLSPARAQAYAAAIGEALHGASAFDIEFNGLTLVPAGVLLQGYPAPALQLLRERVRAGLLAAGLPVKERYLSVSAHVTAVRFPQVPAQPAALADYVQARRELPVGRQRVAELLLVWNDWYNRQQHRQVLTRYQLPHGS